MPEGGTAAGGGAIASGVGSGNTGGNPNHPPASTGGDGVHNDGGNEAFVQGSIPWWFDEEDPLLWDTVTIAGEIFPGIASVTGSGLKRRIDVKTTKGSDGASITDEGVEPAKIEVQLLIYNKFFWDQLQGLIEVINPRKKGSVRNPVTIDYPTLRLLNITRIYVEAIAVPEFDKREGMLTATLSCIEWFPSPKPANPNTKSAKDAADEDGALGRPDGFGQEFEGQDPADAAGGFGPAQSGGIGNAGNQGMNAVCNTFPDYEECV